MARLALAAVCVLVTSACGQGSDGPPLETVYRRADRVLQRTLSEAAPLAGHLSAGPPGVSKCFFQFEGFTGFYDADIAHWVEYETPEEAAALMDAVAASWRGQGFEVAPFNTFLVVFPSGPEEFRLDFEQLPERRRFVLEAHVGCLRPTTGSPPRGIPGPGDDHRDLRGPAAEDRATVAVVRRWIDRLFADTIDAAGAARARDLPPRPLVPCFGYAEELFTADHDVFFAASDPEAALEAIEGTWGDRRLDVRSGSLGDHPAVVGTLGDLTVRARAEGGRVFLHGATPCLPRRA